MDIKLSQQKRTISKRLSVIMYNESVH